MKNCDTLLRGLRFLYLLLLLLGLAILSEGQIIHQSKHSIVLVLIDGCRWDLVNSTTAPNLEQLARSGARGEMIPVWPTVSSPNHWALISGLYPIHGGVYLNEMYDPAAGKAFDWNNENWGDGETILAAAARQGGISSVVGYWLGGFFRAGHNRPSFQIPYLPKYDRDLLVGTDNRADILLDLLDQSDEARPDVIALSVDDVDDAEHRFGVQSPQANQALWKVDEMFKQFVEGLKVRNLDSTTDIVIVADHGQMNTSTERTVFLDDYIDFHQFIVRPSGSGPVFPLWPKKGVEAGVISQLQKANPHLKVWRTAELPNRLHCCKADREPPILLTVDPGWNITLRGDDPFGPGVHGNHGYDNEVREMHALFIANGPAIRRGVELKPFNNVDIYSLLANLLKIKPVETDGSLRSLCSALVDPPVSCSVGQ